ncbi:FAD dependent oxidoreductase [Sanghuangporus baumii]|uniref:FAD dependent oxidoreductase n=1 Tax=Sanghuangporus baumii TaxID=108892 RepID=A0A9Q5N5B9_SANBA|nr:FAD dependent oxidoreductase [Sanghuangporus baumii]
MSADTSTDNSRADTEPFACARAGSRSIVVLGAGVIGLTIAHVLSDDPGNKVTIVARELPGDHLFSQGWSSPWAGANWSPLGVFNERKLKWEKATFEKLWSMIPSGLVMFRLIPEAELPDGYKAGYAFTTVSLKPAVYLKWLRDELAKRGTVFVHKHVASIEEAAALSGPGSIVVNATGLGSKSLLGVEDPDVYPIRGQTILVDAPLVKEFLAIGSTQKFKLDYETTYIIPRPDGTCILGGTYQEDDYDLAVNHDIAKRIYERCTTLEPRLHVSQGAKILSLNVGLRPARRGGPRVELETIQLPLKNDLVPHYRDGLRTEREVQVIHAYGLGYGHFDNTIHQGSSVLMTFADQLDIKAHGELREKSQISSPGSKTD